MDTTPAKENATSKLLPITLASLSRELTNLAILRQANITKADLSVFSKRLAEEDPGDVTAALKALGAEERREGETAFPAMPTILARVADQKRLRLTRAQANWDRKLVCWRCPKCDATFSGFLVRGADTFRTCARPLGNDQEGRRILCGYEMQVIHDDRSAA